MTYATSDSGTQATPHYCTHPGDMMASAGCPRWPSCATLDDPDEEPDEDDVPGLAVMAAILLGVVFFGAVASVVLAVIIGLFL